MLTFTRIAAAFVFMTSIAAAAPRPAVGSPAKPVAGRVLRVLNGAALKGVFADGKVFSARLDRALGEPVAGRR